MSGTRSPSLKAQATRSAIIVSHGQPSDPDPAERALADLTARVAALMPGWRLASATLAKHGALDAAVAEVGRDALIYPLFMTDGWFTQTTLPKRLGAAQAHILAPLGTDPSLPDLAVHWLAEELRTRRWQARETTLIVASHGSGKSRNSARDTRRFTDALTAAMPFADVRTGYIEESPFLGDIVFDLPEQSICLPFFAAEGGHVTDDIPEALDLADFRGLRLAPVGTHPAIPALVAQALHAEARRLEAA
ncbi:CbiX/SirB N-terminal domain-containing protein [Sedimentitalea sp. JM2-8]|uniref:CbiX/SirB N-terminal domain-containing protein n=1 Tax=Sedimentitalea xiamensis TaxID=3050037 RepID=A0ABT7FDY5_9RHOB|nr:CbiX/SirB N-terminal domain-containing protein [Sedimentitalea xiamensis]MDK3073324.1 CbiX/SirB N-terminal domain-containing protein [Sedimentitalea xiamensis]